MTVSTDPLIVWAASIGGGYLLGSIPFGVIATHLAGAGDLRQIGSGSIGATNVLRTGRRDLALLTLVGDAGKGAVAALMAGYLFGPLGAVLAAGAAFFGHLFPVWLKFHGGKGVATFFGTMFAISWPVGIASGLTWLAMAALFRISSLAGLTAAAFAPLFVYAVDPGGEDKILRVYLAMFMALLIFIRHHQNIGRLLSGHEPRIGEGKAPQPQ